MNTPNTTLLVNLNDIQAALDLATETALIRADQNHTKRQADLLDWISEKDFLELLGKKDRKNLKELCNKYNIPVSKFGNSTLYSKEGINSYLHNVSIMNIKC